MKKLMKKLNEKGASLVEYTLLVGLISVVVIASLILIAPQLQTIWTAVVNAITSAAGYAV